MRFWIGCFAGLAIGGCGGGGGNAEAPPSDITAGSFRVSGQLKSPLVSSGTSATVYALSGAITKATMTDLNPTIEETEILFSRESGSNQTSIMGCSPDGTNLRSIHTTTGLVRQVFASTSWVYFVNAANELRRVAMGGGASSSLLKTGVNSFALTPDGTKIVFQQSANYKFSNADGTSEVLMANVPAANFQFVGCRDNLFAYATDTTGVHRINIAAASTFFLFQATSGNPVCAIDGPNRRMYTLLGNTLTRYALGGSLVGTINSGTTTGSIGTLAASPDGKSLVGSVVGSTDTVFTCTADPSQFSRTTIVNEYILGSTYWSPFVTSRQFVPANVYTTGAAALLFSEFGKRMPALVLADCTTRASMVVTKAVSDNLSNVVYRLDCDDLSKLHYTKANSYAFNSVVTAAAGLKGCFVSFDAQSGEVTSVLTFTRSPSTRRVAGGFQVAGEGMVYFNLRTKHSLEPQSVSEHIFK